MSYARISFGILLCAALGCDGASNAPAAPVASRFEAVTAKQTGSDALAGFCDVSAAPGAGKAFKFPVVEGTPPTATGQDRFLWLNLWATWCKPCVEEMPMIAGWQKRFESDGKAVDLQFVSVDEDATAVGTFQTQHPGSPASMHIADPSALAALIAELGLDPGAGLPIHVFVDKGAHVRCVRAGAVTDAHYAVIAGML